MMPREYPRGCIPPEYSLTQKEAAEFLGMSIRALEQRCQRLKKRMPFVWFYQNSRIVKMFNRQELLEWQSAEFPNNQDIEKHPFPIKRYEKGCVPKHYTAKSIDLNILFNLSIENIRKRCNRATDPLPHAVEVFGGASQFWFNLEEVAAWIRRNEKPQA